MTRPGLPTFATIAAAALLATTPAVADPPPHAKAWGHLSRQADRYDDGYRHRDRRDYDDRHRHDGYCDHRDGRRDWYDDHDRYASRHVYIVHRLPYGHRHIDHRGRRYYYDRHGDWYEPYRSAYVRVAPPAGLIIDSRGIAVVANVPIVRW